jgi:hypothetical protein
MKEQLLKHFDLIFLEVQVPPSNLEDKIANRQRAVQYLSKTDRFIYVQEGKRLVKPFQSIILMRILCILFSGPKPQFLYVLRGKSAITRSMLALACTWVSF